MRLPRSSFALLAATLALGCHAQTPPPAIVVAPAPSQAATATAMAAPKKMRFAWPVPGSVAVTQRAEKDGHKVTMRYDLTVKRGAPGAPLEVRFERFRFLDLDGRDAADPALRSTIEKLSGILALIPTLLVSPEGEYVGSRGLDEMIDALLARDRAGKDPATLAAVDRFMRSPEFKATIEQKTGDYWRVWVEMWKDLELAPGERSEQMLEVSAMGSGATVPAVFEHHGAVPGMPGLVRLSMSSVLDGEAARAVLAGILAEITKQMGGAPIQFDRMRRETHASVDTDPLTSRPRRVRMEVLTEAAMAGLPAKQKRQVDEYEFDWTAGGK